jgi:NitT/TauT family transport system permease protein
MTTTTVGGIADLAARPSRLRRRATAVAYPAAAIVFIVLLWQAVVVGLRVQVFVMPTPVSVGQALVENWQLLLSNLVPTAIESLLGFLAGNVFAAVLAVVFVSSRSMERAFFPLAVVLRTIPIVAIAPVLVLMLGYGYAPKVVIAALITFFPTLVNLVRGLNAIEPQQAELLRVLSASSAEVMTKVRVFAALPYLFAALKIGAPAAVIGAIVAEWIGARAGIGYLIIQETQDFLTPLLYATMIVASLFALLMLVVVSLIERAVVRWDPGAEARNV